MKKRRCLTVILILALVLGTPACADMLLTWNEVNGEGYGATVGAHAFAERIEALSGGEIRLDMYTEGTLGTEMESLQGLKMGTLDFFRGNASQLPAMGAELIGATGLPYVFSDMNQFREFSQSELGQALLDSVEEANCGFIALAWMVEGPRSLFITEQAYQAIGAPETVTMDDVKGLNVRTVPGNTLIENTMYAIGADATPITYSELKQSLQSGSVDGAENGVTTYVSNGFYEVAPYFIEDAHLFGCGVILMSKERWDSLDEQQKDWIRQAADVASEACYEYNLSREQDCFDMFDDIGAKLLPVTDIERWEEACKPLYEQQSDACREIISRIQKGDY